MAKLKELTQLEYDRVMVFPHRIAPERTLAVLKQNNFIATANGDNVPLDAEAPKDPLFYLRPVTLRYANFPSLRRYSAEVTVSPLELAINAFLGNPLLFYGHECMFASGPDAFNPVADAVNKLLPETCWTNLEHITRNLYLIRRGRSNEYDVDLLSPNVTLTNPGDSVARFRISKQENCIPPIFSITANGEAVEFEVVDGQLRFELSLVGGDTKKIDITYNSDVQEGEIDWSKNSVHVALLRRLSDFRDITLSKSWTAAHCGIALPCGTFKINRNGNTPLWDARRSHSTSKFSSLRKSRFLFPIKYGPSSPH